MIAVLHEDPELAEQALKKIKANGTSRKPRSMIKPSSTISSKSPPRGKPFPKAGTGRGRKSVQDDHRENLLERLRRPCPDRNAHGSGQVQGGKVTIWASTQTPFGVKGEVATALGLSAGEVQVITPFVGGGFGGKGTNDQAAEAAKLARIAGGPFRSR